MLRLMLALAVVFVASRLTLADDARPSPGKQVAVKAESYNYLLFVPAGYEAAKERWPLLVFLHGSGERGDDLALVQKHGPPKIVETKPDFPFVVVSPQVPNGQRWEAEKVMALIDSLGKSSSVDPARVYVTGLSMGGSGTWSVAAAYPDRLAAIVPICGRGEVAEAEKIKHIPCWVFMGAKDKSDLVQWNDEMVAALKKAGGVPKYTVYPEAGHDSWTESYNNPELWKWLLKQKR